MAMDNCLSRRTTRSPLGISDASNVTDAVFSAENPEHVEIANRIEIRLVDLDLLPRYADLLSGQ